MPPTSAFFSNTVTAMPAWRIRCAAARPEAPAPITAQRNVPPTSSMCHVGRRGSLPARASSSTRKGAHWSVESTPTRKPRIRRRISSVNAGSGAPGSPVSQESGCGQAPRLLFLFGRQAASGDEELPLVRLELPAQQREVPRAVRHRAQERVHVGRGEGRFDPRCVDHARRLNPPCA